MFDRPRSGERCLILHVAIGRPLYDDEAQEFRALATSAGATIVAETRTRRAKPDPHGFVGRGKVAELAQSVKDTCAALVLVNQPLTPSQERNLERALGVRVLDRNGLILDIFAQRARSFEGKLQVELAQLRHLSTRLVRGWSHLERQKGGIGLRGPGETQLETDRRLVGHRIKALDKRLQRVARQRDQSRKVRRRADVPTVALVGYTNAGKSTLFNHLTGADALAQDKLFATLDPTLRRLELSRSEAVVLADTVGFVRDLPHELVAAFSSTLLEASEADLLIHVIDASDPHRLDRQHQVEAVLSSIGAGQVPTIHVFNKVDILGEEPRLDGANGSRPSVWLSASTGAGVDLLLQALKTEFAGRQVTGKLHLEPQESRLRARLFALDAVRREELDEMGGWVLDVELPAHRFKELCAAENLSPARLEH